MPQELHVLRCYACDMYQVHIVKKSNKWNCKICGENQSIQVVYFRGSGIDCRYQVQRLNSLKAPKAEQQSFSSPTIEKYGLDCTAEENSEPNNIDDCQCPKRRKTSNGKWSQYLEESEVDESDDDSGEYHDALDDTDDHGTSQKLELLQHYPGLRSSTEHYQSFPRNRERPSTPDFQEFCNSKSHSYPLTERTRRIVNRLNQYADDEEEKPLSSSSDEKIPSKWDKFLKDPKVGKVSSVDVDEEIPTNKSPASNDRSTMCNFFEDYNDDLDLTIDF